MDGDGNAGTAPGPGAPTTGPGAPPADDHRVVVDPPDDDGMAVDLDQGNIVLARRPAAPDEYASPDDEAVPDHPEASA